VNSKYLLFLLIILIVPIVQADDITFKLNQSEYFFKVNENAIINLRMENTYGKRIEGMLSNAITQSINQQGVQYSSSNTNTVPFAVEDKDTESQLNFGVSNSPTTLTVNMKFSYTEDQIVDVTLDEITIHFVEEESQKQNKQDEVSSESEKTEQQKPSQEQLQEAQQKLQNNQMPQDSSALKQEMQKQAQEQQQMKEEFQKQISQNPEFNKEHQDLLDKGYNVTESKTSPVSNNTGDFELKYEKPTGEQASLKGEMKDGEMQSLEKQTSGSKEQMLEQLNQNEKFQKYKEQLQNEGFEEKEIEFNQVQNKTTVSVNFQKNDTQNTTALIKSEIVNNTVEKVELVTAKDKNNYWWFLLFISLIVFFVYNKFLKKHPKKIIATNKGNVIDKPFDYKAESLSILEKAKVLFEKGQHKDAYQKAGQALRLYLSYKNSLRKEITNDDIINFLRRRNKSFKKSKECFDLCSLVEFAKYQANEADFKKIVRYAQKVIS